MDPKPRPNQRLYLQVLRSMTPQQRLMKAFELGELGKQLMKAGLRLQYPSLGEAELHQKFLGRLAKCHNRNY